jgi:hypothetical protein
LQTDINFQAVKNFRKLLVKEKKNLLKNDEIVNELFSLKDLILKLEDVVIETRSRIAAAELSKMTEEERRMLSMAPDEKKFFLAYKAKHPQNPWAYFAAYQKQLQKEYKLQQKALV